MKKSISEKVEQFKEFYKKENLKPILGFFIGNEFPIPRYPCMKNLPQGRALNPDDFVISEFVSDVLYLYDLHDKHGGDFLFSESAYWGIPWMEVFLGMDIYADQSSGSLYAKIPENFDINNINDFNPQNEWAVLCKNMLIELDKTSLGRFPLATTRMRGVADLLSLIYGEENFVFAMYDNVDEVEKLTTFLTNLFIDFGKFQLRYIPQFHGGIGSFYYYMWAPYGTVWHQEDIAALLSPQLYAQFIQPCDEKIANVFSGCIMHQHPTGYMMYEKLVDMNFTALELHIDTGGKTAQELSGVHRKILEKKPLCIWGNLSDDDFNTLFNELPLAGLAVICMIEESDIKRAKHLYDKYIVQ